MGFIMEKRNMLWKKIVFGAGFMLLGAGLTIGVQKIYSTTVEEKERKAIEEVSGPDYNITESISLGDYEKLEVSLAVSEDDMQTEIESLLEEHTVYEQKQGKVVDGDMVYARFEGFIDGKKSETASGEDYVSIGSGEWLAGFEQALIGVKTGKTKKVTIDVPEGTYGDEELDGKKVTFHIKPVYICGDAIIPDLNDEFIQSATEYNSVAEYKEHLKERLMKENEDDKEEYAWTEMVELCTANEYPSSLMEQAKKEVLQGYYDMAELYNQTHDEIFQSFGCENEQEFVDTQLEELAKDTVKEILVAKGFSYAENIDYSPEEYKELVKEEYESYGFSYGNQEEYEKVNKNHLENTALINAVKKWLGQKVKFIR